MKLYFEVTLYNGCFGFGLGNKRRQIQECDTQSEYKQTQRENFNMLLCFPRWRRCDWEFQVQTLYLQWVQSTSATRYQGPRL